MEVNGDILILEDDLYRIEFFKMIFNDRKVFITNNPDAAMDELDKNDYDTIFIDYDLGIKTGLYFASALVQNGKHKDAKIIVHSMNSIGAEKIARSLNSAGYSVCKIPYSDIVHDILQGDAVSGILDVIRR